MVTESGFYWNKKYTNLASEEARVPELVTATMTMNYIGNKRNYVFSLAFNKETSKVTFAECPLETSHQIGETTNIQQRFEIEKGDINERLITLMIQMIDDGIHMSVRALDNPETLNEFSFTNPDNGEWTEPTSDRSKLPVLCEAALAETEHLLSPITEEARSMVIGLLSNQLMQHPRIRADRDAQHDLNAQLGKYVLHNQIEK